jgi:hypothetical protein
LTPQFELASPKIDIKKIPGSSNEVVLSRNTPVPKVFTFNVEMLFHVSERRASPE